MNNNYEKEDNISKSMSSHNSGRSNKSNSFVSKSSPRSRSRSRSRFNNYSPNNYNINLNYDNDNFQKRNNQNLGNKFKNYNQNRRERNNNSDNTFVMRNGCCRNCMKAFSKNGKSCLCQVPRKERKFHLPENGCNYCGCKGCNPLDMRYNGRMAQKSILFQDKSINHKNQRILDSDDEDLKIKDNIVDSYNMEKKEIKMI